MDPVREYWASLSKDERCALRRDTDGCRTHGSKEAGSSSMVEQAEMQDSEEHEAASDEGDEEEEEEMDEEQALAPTI